MMPILLSLMIILIRPKKVHMTAGVKQFQLLAALPVVAERDLGCLGDGAPLAMD